MVVQSKETKVQASLIELLGGSSKSKSTKTNNAFGQLLATLASASKEGETADFTTVIDPKKSTVSSKTSNITTPTTKKTNVKSLEELLGKEDESKLLPKTLVDTLSPDQVRTLISRAKEYLKSEITAKSPDMAIDTKTLPKTLMGLVQLADKMGLNPTEITLSTLIPEPAEQAKFSPAVLTQPLLNAKLISSPSVQTTPSQTFEAITQLLHAVKTKDDVTKNESKSETDKKEVQQKQPLSSLLQNLDKPIEPKTAGPVLPAVPVISSVPVLPAVSTKIDELVSLLQEKPKKEETLQGAQSSTNAIDASKIQAPNADALEVKTKEAAQSMRYFATDLKEAVDSYKPPFTRLSMTLNPEKLGEVEVTLVQRGNNVHVSIQSNNVSSVAFLAHNATELKAQLAGQGITNATMNFMSGGDGQSQNQGQQQNQQQQQNRFRAYESLKDIEMNGEQLSALEIIIPHYA
jgi:flagellar hook-length control protein FliK